MAQSLVQFQAYRGLKAILVLLLRDLLSLRGRSCDLRHTRRVVRSPDMYTSHRQQKTHMLLYAVAIYFFADIYIYTYIYIYIYLYVILCIRIITEWAMLKPGLCPATALKAGSRPIAMFVETHIDPAGFSRNAGSEV